MNESRLKELRQQYYTHDERVRECEIDVKNALSRRQGEEGPTYRAALNYLNNAKSSRQLCVDRILNEIGD